MTGTKCRRRQARERSIASSANCQHLATLRRLPVELASTAGLLHDFGWLIAIGIVGLYLLRRDWSPKLKLTAVALVLVLGLGVFAVRFHNYLSAGATSVSARFDYWHAAAQTAADRPVFGTGPGTFQRPYARLKSPAAEMARLTHNDYLEQFSDSGYPAGLAYTAWIILALVVAGKKVWSAADPALFAVFAGVLAWFVQGLGEFGLYVPAQAWIAFALLGSLVGMATDHCTRPNFFSSSR